jgi:hypothetical protein
LFFRFKQREITSKICSEKIILRTNLDIFCTKDQANNCMIFKNYMIIYVLFDIYSHCGLLKRSRRL